MSPIAALVRVSLTLSLVISEMGRAKTTSMEWSSHPDGMIFPHFSSFLTGKAGRSSAILYRSPQPRLLQGKEKLGVEEASLRNHLWVCWEAQVIQHESQEEMKYWRHKPLRSSLSVNYAIWSLFTLHPSKQGGLIWRKYWWSQMSQTNNSPLAIYQMWLQAVHHIWED